MKSENEVREAVLAEWIYKNFSPKVAHYSASEMAKSILADMELAIIEYYERRQEADSQSHEVVEEE